MVAVKGAQSKKHPLRLVLFGVSVVLCLLSIYLMLDFQTSSEAKLSGELILGQVDTVNYNQQQNSPILSFFFEYYGILSYLFAFTIVYLGYYLILKPVDIWRVDFYKVSLRIVGFNFFILGLAGLSSKVSTLGSTGAGGLLGDMLNIFLGSFLPNFIIYILFAFCTFSGLAYLLGRNPFFFYDRIGEGFFKILPAKKVKQDKKVVEEQDNQNQSVNADNAREAEAAADPLAGIAAINAAASGKAALTVSDEVAIPEVQDISAANQEQLQQLDLERAFAQQNNQLQEQENQVNDFFNMAQNSNHNDFNLQEQNMMVNHNIDPMPHSTSQMQEEVPQYFSSTAQLNEALAEQNNNNNYPAHEDIPNYLSPFSEKIKAEENNYTEQNDSPYVGTYGASLEQNRANYLQEDNGHNDYYSSSYNNAQDNFNYSEPQEEEKEVHTIVQRTDPQVFQAQMQALKEQKEAQEAKQRELNHSAINNESTDEAPVYLRPGNGDEIDYAAYEQELSQDENVLAEPNEHEIGVRLPQEKRPRTIIQDTRKEFEESQAQREKEQKDNISIQHNAITNGVETNLSAQEEVQTNNSEQDKDIIDIADKANNLSVDEQVKEEIDTQADKGLELSVNNEAIEQEAENTNNDSPDSNSTLLEAFTSLAAEIKDVADSTHEQAIDINLDSVKAKDNEPLWSENTSISRSEIKRPNKDEEDSFARYALAHANERQESVEVNLFGSVNEDLSSREKSLYSPQHAYEFEDGKKAGSITPSDIALQDNDLDDYIGGASALLSDEESQNLNIAHNQQFSFAKIAEQNEVKNLPDSVPQSVSSSLFADSKNDENIISFAPNSNPHKSYEVESLSSAFIPMAEFEDHDKAIENGIVLPKDNNTLASNATLEAEKLASEMEKMAEVLAYKDEQSARVLLSSQEDGVDNQHSDNHVDVVADATSNLNEIKSDEALESNATDNNHVDIVADATSNLNEIKSDEAVESNATNNNHVDMASNNLDELFSGDALDRALMEQDFDPMFAMGASNVYPNMQQVPQVQYVQMPNGQFVPVMPPNMQQQMAQVPPMQQVPQVQYVQMPNGQFVPVMQPNMMYGMQQNQAQMPNVSETNNINNASTSSYQNSAVQQAPATLDTSDNPDSNNVSNAPAVGMPGVGNNFMGAHNSSSSNLPSYVASVNQGSFEPGVKGSAALCSVPRRAYDSWRPSLDLLARSNSHVDVSLDELEKTAQRVNEVLQSFNVKAKVADYLTGPVITRFDLELAPGVKSSAISSIETELCRNLMVPNVRVVPIIEGSSYVGLEVPNHQRQFITLGDMASSREFMESKASLPMCLGASVIGAPVVKDLAESPHLLVAGTTGSGKSAGLNTMLISLLLKRSPAELRLILVDPKQLEFSIYKDLPHLITPVITDVAEKTPIALNWCVDEMERRFKLMSLLGVRKLSEYNEYINNEKAQGRSVADPLWNTDMGPHPQALEPLPWIVVVIEEFADLMAQSGRKRDKDGSPESLIARLSAKSRAAGIHLILVTQTPRAEVVTGMIKANFPSRVAFTVQNRTDSTIVLDEKGAESLLGNGDMLYKFTGAGTATRAHGAFTSNQDVRAVVEAWRQFAGAPEYLDEVVSVPEVNESEESESKVKDRDVKLDDAIQLVREYMEIRNKPPTITDLQTELGVGYPRAKKIYKQLTIEGVIV